MLPALEHQLVDGRRTVHRSGEPEGLVDGLHHLMKRRNEDMAVVSLKGSISTYPAQTEQS